MLKIRAHHLLCTPRFYGGGYDKKFGKNMKKICFDIRKNPDLKIKIIQRVDDLCAKCPHRKGKSCMKTSIKDQAVLIQDNKVLKKLKLKKNSVHKAKNVFNLSMEKIPNVKSICEGCEFIKSCLKWGINNSFRKELKFN